MTSDQRLQTILRELPVPEPSPDFFDRLEAQLYEELDNFDVIDLRDTPRRRPWLQWRRFPAWVAAAAAIALLAAAIGIAVTLITDTDRIPEVVEAPTGNETEGATGTLDFSAIAGTWQGELYPLMEHLPVWVEITIDPSADHLTQVGIARYRDEVDGPMSCMSRWLAREATPPEYQVVETGVGSTPCPSEPLRRSGRQNIHERVRLTHDPDTDTLSFEFIDADLPPKPLERVPNSASGPDLLGSSRFAVPFVIDAEVTGLIRCQCAVEEQEVGFRSSKGELVFTVAGPKSVDAWQRKFAEAPGTSVTEPFLADVGGMTGTAIDATMGDENLLLYTIAPQPGQVSQYAAEAGDRVRVISLEIASDDPLRASPADNWIVSVIISAQAEDFDDWLATVEPLLERLRWNVSPADLADPSSTIASDELPSGEFAVPFTMPRDELDRVSASPNNQAEEAWFGAGRTRSELLWPRPTDLLVFTTEGPDSVEAWISQISASEEASISVSEPFATSIGGVEGRAIDATVSDGEYILYSINLGNTPPLAVTGDVFQIHVVEVDGEPVTVILIATEDDFGPWIQLVGPMLEGLEWGATS